MKVLFLVASVVLYTLGAADHSRAGAPVAVVYVDATATGAKNGKNWDDAYTSLSTAITNAPAFSEIWVARGTYKPQGFLPSRSTSFQLKNNVAILGGFRGNETSQNSRDFVANPTILSGDIGSVSENDNSYHVVAATNVSSARLDGFTIRGGTANGTTTHKNGAGILLTNSSPSLVNLVITGNTASGDGGLGGGIYISQGSPLISHVAFIGNSAKASGGGLYALAGHPTLGFVRFEGNHATASGGGLYQASGAMSVSFAVFEANSTTFASGAIGSTGTLAVKWALFHGNSAPRGAGILSYQGNLTVENSTFSGNVAYTYGAAIASEAGANPGKLTISSSTFTANTGGGATIFNGTSDAALPALVQNSLAWGNTGGAITNSGANAQMTVVDSLVEGGCPANTTCSNADILNVDPRLGPLADNGGFSKTHVLLPGSPAIDSADEATCPANDQRDVSRPVDGDKNGTARCDIGAVEVVPAAPTVAFAAKASSAAEAASTFPIAVKLSTTSIAASSVKYRVIGGTALGKGRDYTLAAGTLTFPPLTTSRTIPVAIVNDRLDEPVETVILQLYAATGATLAERALHTLRIKDDDPRLLCRGRVATITGTDGADTLTGTGRADVIVALGGNDVVAGNGGDDVICAGGGNDRVNGGNGNDVIVGQAGNDRLFGAGGHDQLFAGGGADRLSGGPGWLDVCDGGGGKDTLLPAHGCEARAGIP